MRRGNGEGKEGSNLPDRKGRKGPRVSWSVTQKASVGF